MKKQAVLSALGRDRVGVADDLTDLLSNRELEIEDSRMTAFGGRFALILQLCGEPEHVKSLEEDLANLAASLGFHLQLDPIESKLPPMRAPRYLVESFSSGPSGLSHVTRILKKHHINIEDLETEATDGPWTSKITFHMQARISIPSSCSIGELKKDLRALEMERDLDILIKPAPVTSKSLVDA